MFGRFLHRGSAPIGLDIGTSGARLLQLTRRGGAIEVGAAVAVSRRATTGENPLTPEMIESIKQRLETGSFHGRECVMTFPDHWLATRSVRLPVMPENETNAALALEAAERLGFDDENPGEVSWVRAGRVRQGDDSRDEIILVGVERAPLTNLVDAVAETGLRPIAVEPSFLSIARAYSRRHRRQGDTEVVRAILDIGRRNTGVSVLKGDNVAFYKPLRVSGSDFTDAVAKKLSIGADSAFELRQQRIAASCGAATACDESVDRSIYEAVRPLIDELAKETALCLRYFSVAFTGERPTMVLTAGDDAAEPKLAEALAETLRIEARVGAPLEDISVSDQVRLGHPGALHVNWATAVGLSLRGLPEAAVRARKDGPARAEPDAPAEAPQRAAA